MYPLSLPTLICIVSKAFLTETLREDSRHRGDSPPKKITMTILKKGWDKYFRISLNAAKEVDKCLVMCILPRPHQCRRSPRTFPAPPHSPHSPGQWLVKAPVSLHLVVHLKTIWLPNSTVLNLAICTTRRPLGGMDKMGLLCLVIDWGEYILAKGDFSEHALFCVGRGTSATL